MQMHAQVHDGPRPWDDEPDKLEWIDDATRLHCLILRAPVLGGLCGYVGGRRDWPWFGIQYLTIEDIGVHGGLTFSGPLPGQDPTIWWIGFDCMHAWDLVPMMRSALRDDTLHYRDIEFVRREVTSLARQLHEAGGPA